MKKTFFKILILFIILVPVLSFSAEKEYIPLTSIPGVYEAGKAVNLGEFIKNAFIFIIGIAASFGFVMLVIEGFGYMFTSSFNVKANYKARILRTLKGLFAVIISYTIIYEINPDALNLKLELKVPDLKKSEYVIMAQSDKVFGDEATTRKFLKDRDISVNHTNPCPAGQTQGCTSLAGLSSAAVAGLVGLKENCKCSVMITGGTEGGHKTHGVGKGQVDLNPTSDLNTFLGKPNPKNGEVVTREIHKKPVTFTYETTGANGTATGNHWHASF